MKKYLCEFYKISNGTGAIFADYRSFAQKSALQSNKANCYLQDLIEKLFDELARESPRV